MLSELSWRLGVGVVLAWVALPLLVRLARHNLNGPPEHYYRALVAALGIATALILAPVLRARLGLGIVLPLAGQQWLGSDAASVSFVADWVRPLLATSEQPWAAMPLARLLSVIGSAWALLAVAGIAHSLFSRAALRRAYRNAALAPVGVLERAQALASELGIRVPEMRVAEGLHSAFTFGFISPVVVLDASVCKGAEADLDFTLRHELLHVARSDTRAAFAIDVLQRCFTGHPCLRRLAVEIRFAREASVDELAAGASPLEYARFLLLLAERLRSVRPSLSLVSMADTALERRVEMLITSMDTGSRVWRGSRWVGSFGLALGGLVLLAPSSWGQGGNAGAAPGIHPRVVGNLSVAQVEGAMFAQSGAFLGCYGMVMGPRPDLSVGMHFEIAPSGGVSSTLVKIDQHPKLERCIEAKLKNIVFPAPSSGSVTVDFPILLTPPLEEHNAARAQAERGMGRLPREVVEEVVRDAFPRFGDCYEALPEPRPTLRELMSFTIDRQGHVTDDNITETNPPNDTPSMSPSGLAQCMAPVLRSLVFPAPVGGIVTVTYPVLVAPE